MKLNLAVINEFISDLTSSSSNLLIKTDLLGHFEYLFLSHILNDVSRPRRPLDDF